jgi:hypothetical protein
VTWWSLRKLIQPTNNLAWPYLSKHNTIFNSSKQKLTRSNQKLMATNERSALVGIFTYLPVCRGTENLRGISGDHTGRPPERHRLLRVGKEALICSSDVQFCYEVLQKSSAMKLCYAVLTCSSGLNSAMQLLCSSVMQLWYTALIYSSDMF